ncbi:hypothetical protein ARMGADRAFT_1078883 [Armillaria gallica]|uniref:CCHC-type domain-containing protein n=1 Tax=Armillaria gallica TaxID=47427 RepID=A0A2H3E0Y0_ARMGA|nr:hypothetical protein ARMGADRAFT_1078883 [Armillaria gallica]
MVCTVCMGIPLSYTNTITGSGLNIPTSYPEWKEWVILIYEHRQRQKAYEEVHGIRQDNKRPQGNPNQKQITSTSSTKNHAAGGATSSSSGNQSGGNKGWGTGAKTTVVKTKMYGGAGEPMQIDQKKYMFEGWCFNCDKKEHISKNCPKLRKQQVQAVEVVEEPKLETM